MPALALRVEERTFREGIVKYVTVLCFQFRVRRSDVRDLMQEALTEIIASVATYRPEKGDFDKWARGIARNVVRRYLRDAKRYAEHFSEYHPNVDEHAAPLPSPERCAQRTQAQCKLSSAAGNLSEREVTVLVLHVVDGMSHGEIGQKLDIKESASQKCYQRTLDKLAQCITEDVLSAMPPFVSGCDEPASTHNVDSRWHEWSHYAGQIAAAIVALLMFVPSNQSPLSHASLTGEIRAAGIGPMDVMYQLDKQTSMHDEPAVHHDAPIVKPEPASLPSVRVVPARTSVADKPPTLEQLMRLPPYKHTVRPSEHTPLGR